MKLADREYFSRQALEPVQSQYAVVFEDPDNPEASTCVLHPAPRWMAMALAGGYLPPIEAYLRDHAKIANWAAAGNDPAAFSWGKVGGAEHPYAAPIGPMTEEQAIEYLIMKDIPPHIWAVKRNRQYFKIVRRETIPADRMFRNAWRMKDE